MCYITNPKDFFFLAEIQSDFMSKKWDPEASNQEAAHCAGSHLQMVISEQEPPVSQGWGFCTLLTLCLIYMANSFSLNAPNYY